MRARSSRSQSESEPRTTRGPPRICVTVCSSNSWCPGLPRPIPRSVAQRAEAVQLVIHLVAPHVRLHILPDFGVRHRATGEALAYPIHLAGPDVGKLSRGLLVLVHAEGGQKTRQPREPGAGLPKTQQEIPVQRKTEALVHRAAGLLPDAAPPEQRLLWNVVRPGEDPIVVWRQHPAPDLGVVGVDQHAMAVHDIDLGMTIEIGRH